jgi:S-sulfo-L-cysteine synthase (O-acetyl-L-serine-dependent)
MPRSLHRSRRLSSILDAVGNTPVIRLDRIGASVPGVELYLKLEFANPGGSVKDRPALGMVLHALETGAFSEDKILIDATSGNTGVAYSLIGAALGLRVQLVMPSNVTRARKDITQAFGTQLIYSDPMEGSDGAIVKVRDIVAREPDKYFYCDQYSNPQNPMAHYRGTGAEILDAFGDRITHFVAGLGTSGTVMGTTRRLHEHHRKIHCVAVEPAEALHGLEGLKHMASSIQPGIYDATVPDEILPVPTDEGWDMTDRLGAEEGLHVGHSTGANVSGALKIAERLHKEKREGCIVIIACDRGDRYFAPMKWEKRYTW